MGRKKDADGNWKYGYVDKTGAVAVPLEYDDDRVFYSDLIFYPRFSDGLAPAAKIDADGNFKYGFVDKTGSVVVPLEYDRVFNFSEGLAVVGKRGADGMKFGYIDTTGAVVVPLEYENVLSGWYNGGVPGFFDGLAAVGKMDAGRGWGYVDKTGAVVIPVEYDRMGMIYDRCTDGYDYENYQPSRYRWVQKGASYGIFENPYYEASKNGSGGGSAGGGFPVVPVVIAVVVVAAAVVLVLALKKKKTE